MSRLRGVLTFGLLAVALALPGCSKPPPPPPPPPPVQVTPPAPPPPPPFVIKNMELGSAVGIDNRVTAPASTYNPKDTIYLSVLSDGVAPAVVLRAKWTYGPKGILVSQQTESISSLGPKATKFPISKPSGFPLGSYTVELFANDTSAGTKHFDVVAKAPAKKH